MASVEELKQRYVQLNSIDGIDEFVLQKIEGVLKVKKLPAEFRQISDFFSGGLLGGIDNFAFAYEGISPNIVEETLRLRAAIKLPTRFIVLAEPPESLIVMDTENTPSVIWCDATDAERISTLDFVTEPQKWNTYLDFFNTMLDDEEDERIE